VSDLQLNKYLAGSICATDVCTYRFRRNVDKDHASTTFAESESSQMTPARPEAVSTKATQEPTFIGPVRTHEDPAQVLVATSQAPEDGCTSVIMPPSGADSPQSLHLDPSVDLLHTGTPIGFGELCLELEEHERCYGQDSTYSHQALSNKEIAGRSSPSAQRADARVGDTSCVEAAKIIASLRGCNLDEDMWSELGCRAMQSCRVQNIAVFQLMDKA